MKFLIDRCAGQRLADWLTANGHDAQTTWADSRPDPDDLALLRLAAEEERILVTIDKDFGICSVRFTRGSFGFRMFPRP